MRFCLHDTQHILRENKAQATVEMAVVVPVLLVLALIVYNVMLFVSATARFDRVAPDLVLAHGVAPAGDEGLASSRSVLIQEKLEQAMKNYNVRVVVSEESNASDKDDGLLSMVGALRTYRCEFKYTPWPSGLSIAGVSLGAPIELTHVRTITVDPWRSGVVT